MPKRILDDSYLDSRSIEVLSPAAQDAFPRFILLADDFGCFEVNVTKIRANGWSRRPDVTEEMVEGWIKEYAECQAIDPEHGKKLPPLLMLWTHVGRRYAFLTGWFGPHGQKRRAEYDPNAPAGTPGRHGSKRKTPRPPADILAAIMAGDVRPIDGKPPGTDREETGNEDSETLSNFTPAREMTGKTPGDEREAAGKCMVPGPAVPVAVPVAAATGSAAAAAPPAAPTESRTFPPPADGVPSDGAAASPVSVEPPRRLVVVDESGPHEVASPFPLTECFRADLAAALARTAPHPVGGGRPVFESCERALAVIGVECAVEVCRQRVLDAVARRERQPATLKFFVDAVLGDELTRRASQPKGPRRCVGADANGQPIWAEAT